MNEKEMRDGDVPRIGSIEELSQYVEALVTQDHDYGTCVYAMSMAATAAFNYVASKLGVTGFQASCADMDILRRTRGYKNGFRVLNYENLLYPQYLDSEHFPSYQDILDGDRVGFAKLAREKLAEGEDHVHPDVLAHWRNLAAKATEGEILDAN